MIAQDARLVPFLSAQENVALALGNRGLSDAESDEAASEALASVGLAELAGQRVARLSLGERQRVAIAARSRAGRSCCWPTSRRPDSTRRTRSRWAPSSARLVEERHTTIVCATHDPLVIDQADEDFSCIDEGARCSAQSPAPTP